MTLCRDGALIAIGTILLVAAVGAQSNRQYARVALYVFGILAGLWFYSRAPRS